MKPGGNTPWNTRNPRPTWISERNKWKRFRNFGKENPKRKSLDCGFNEYEG
jgi:hypothetical protein